MVIDLRKINLSGGKIYILVNPYMHPYIIHSKSSVWSKELIEKLLSGYRIYKPIWNKVVAASTPFILVCGGGFSIYAPGRWIDKFRGGIFRYTLVKSLLAGLLDGSRHREVDISIFNVTNGFLKALITNFSPIIMLLNKSGVEDIFSSLGFKVLYPDKVLRSLRLNKYLKEKYGIFNPVHRDLPPKIYVSYNGRRLSISLGMYSEEDDISIILDEHILDGVSHISYNLVNKSIHIRLNI